jgi:hypothetical protein
VAYEALSAADKDRGTAIEKNKAVLAFDYELKKR